MAGRPQQIVTTQLTETTADQTASIIKRIAAELAVRDHQVAAAVDLLDGGATVPFIARYRKEATGTLDDAQLRTLDERLRYLRELEERRAAILASIASRASSPTSCAPRSARPTPRRGSRTSTCRTSPSGAPRRRSPARTASSRSPSCCCSDPATDPRAAAEGYLNENVADVAAALDGARAILVERFAEDADLIGQLRERMWSRGNLVAKVREGKEDDGKKYSDYFDFAEPFGRLKAHRVLAMFRAEKEEVLDLTLDPADEGFEPGASGLSAVLRAADRGRVRHRRPGPARRQVAVRHRPLGLAHAHPRPPRHRPADAAVAGRRGRGRRRLRRQPADLLLAAPAGQRATMGLDPGFRTGVKVAVVDQTGKVVATHTIYPHVPQHKWDESLFILKNLAEQHHVELIAIGNGTASRETDKLAIDLIKASPELNLTKIVVSEAGASVYSASAYASGELPDLDVSLRGAVSIARRLQDPLAELVKIDPKSIGVGQYQHDVTGTKLERSLDAVVEDAVNAVGVDVNTASRPLLARVSGITDSLAGAIVAHRDAQRRVRAPASSCKDVPRLGPKAFEQCAGFLRIRGGDNPLDASGVHPEAYPVVRRILEQTQHRRGDPDRQHADAARPQPGASSPTRRSASRRSTTSSRNWRSPAATRAPSSRPRPSPRACTPWATWSPAWCSRAWSRTSPPSARSSTSACTRTASCTSPRCRATSSPTRATSPSPGDVVKVKVLSVDIPRNRISLTMRLQDEGDAAARARAGPPVAHARSAGTGPAARAPVTAPPPGPAPGAAPPAAPAAPSAPPEAAVAGGRQRRPGGPGGRGGARGQGGGRGTRRGPPRRCGAARDGGGRRRSASGQARQRPGGQRGGAPGCTATVAAAARRPAVDRGGGGARRGRPRAAASGGGNPGDRHGGGSAAGRGQRRGKPAPAAPANGAMADALRRAGLLNDKGGAVRQAGPPLRPPLAATLVPARQVSLAGARRGAVE